MINGNLNVRRLALGLLPILVAGLALALTAAPALAFGEHAFSVTFGSRGSEPGEFNEPTGVAVNESSGDVYVADKGNGRIEAFNDKDEYVLQFNGGGVFPNEAGAKAPTVLSSPEYVAVDNDPTSPSFGDVYVTDTDAGHRVIDKFTATGAYINQLSVDTSGNEFTELYGVAVDPHGTLWVYSDIQPAQSNQYVAVDSYSDAVVNVAATLVSSPFDTSGTAGFAVDSHDNLYAGYSGLSVEKVTSSGAIVKRSLDGERALAVGVELSSDTVFIASRRGVVASFGPEGELLQRFGLGLLRDAAGLAVSSTGGEVYVADAAKDVVDVFTALDVAGVAYEQATSVESAAATLQARVDPNGAATSYHFEYDTTPYISDASHGVSVPAPDVSIGSGVSPVLVSVRLQGLAPGGSYYYRVVAESEVKSSEVKDTYGRGEVLTTNALPGSVAESCPNAGLRAEQSVGPTLPDCRAYEMVSPLDKSDNGVAFTSSRASGASGSPAVTYISPGSFAGSGGEPRGAALVSRYLSRRGPEGWSTQNITPPYKTFLPQTPIPFQELLLTPDLSEGVLFNRDTPLVKDEPAGYFNLYLAGTGTGSYQAITDVTPPRTEIEPYEEFVTGSADAPAAVGASTDLGRVVFQQRASLTIGAAPEHLHVYEWTGGGLSQVDVPPEGMKLEGEDTVGSPSHGASPIEEGDVWHAVSADGTRVFFTGGEKQRAAGQLYVRENPTAPPVGESRCGVVGDACTIDVSKSQRTNESGEPEPDPQGLKPAFFRAASVDGAMVFFTSRSELTNDANTGPADNAANLYEYDVETGVLSDLTVDSGETDGAAVMNLVTAGEDGSYVYFVANGVLSDAANREGAKAVPGDCKAGEQEEVTGEPACNLYVEHYNGSTWETPQFVATLTGGEAPNIPEREGDESDWLGHDDEDEMSEEPTLEEYGPVKHTVRTTPNGSILAFVSERSLTGYDNEAASLGECEGRNETGRCREVYLFDAVSGKLVCVSCDATGARPVGPAELGGQEQDVEEDVLGALNTFYVPRNLSEDGGRLFFQTPDALVPSDGNGRLDVYEWERAASAAEAARDENSCTTAARDFVAGREGCVVAISDVTGGSESHFMDATPNGDDVFIATADQLVPLDTDTRVDVYDVRVGGGFPAAAVVPPCTNADSCKPPVSSQPSVFGPSGSATFSGAGNLVPVVSPAAAVAKPKSKSKSAKCRKGFTKKHKKCVRRRTPKRTAGKSERGRD